MTVKATMISFACDGCGRAFSVPTSFAGRKASCKSCGAKVIVPSHVAAIAAEQMSASPAVQVPPARPKDNGNSNDNGNANGKPHPAVAPQRAFAVEPVQPASETDTVAVPSDPPQSQRRAPHAAIISEAQSPPTAAAVSPLPSVGLPAANDARGAAPALAEMPYRDPAPAEEPAPTPAPAPAKVPVRIRRLMVDAEQMAKAFTAQGPIRIKSATGDPPEVYQVEYRVKGLQKGWMGPKTRDTHLVEIQLTSEYPRVSPKCRMLTPVFHPNIDESTVCVTDHWTAGERLVDLVVRIGEMLAYQAYNIKSPLNGEAAKWADLHPKKLPIDSQSLHPGEA